MGSRAHQRYHTAQSGSPQVAQTPDRQAEDNSLLRTLADAWDSLQYRIDRRRQDEDALHAAWIKHMKKTKEERQRQDELKDTVGKIINRLRHQNHDITGLDEGSEPDSSVADYTEEHEDIRFEDQQETIEEHQEYVAENTMDDSSIFLPPPRPQIASMRELIAQGKKTSHDRGSTVPRAESALAQFRDGLNEHEGDLDSVLGQVSQDVSALAAPGRSDSVHRASPAQRDPEPAQADAEIGQGGSSSRVQSFFAPRKSLKTSMSAPTTPASKMKRKRAAEKDIEPTISSAERPSRIAKTAAQADIKRYGRFSDLSPSQQELAFMREDSVVPHFRNRHGR